MTTIMMNTRAKSFTPWRVKSIFLKFIWIQSLFIPSHLLHYKSIQAIIIWVILSFKSWTNPSANLYFQTKQKMFCTLTKLRNQTISAHTSNFKLFMIKILLSLLPILLKDLEKGKLEWKIWSIKETYNLIMLDK